MVITEVFESLCHEEWLACITMSGKARNRGSRVRGKEHPGKLDVDVVHFQAPLYRLDNDLESIRAEKIT